jgi:Fe-S oxidoreductase
MDNDGNISSCFIDKKISEIKVQFVILDCPTCLNIFLEKYKRSLEEKSNYILVYDHFYSVIDFLAIVKIDRSRILDKHGVFFKEMKRQKKYQESNLMERIFNN